jgi:excisionase family DNA binding protein
MRMNKRIRGGNARDRAGQEGGTKARVSLALTRTVQPSVAPARSVVAPGALEAALLAFLHSKTPASMVPVERRIFLSMSESAELSGLQVAFLRRLIAAGKLKALRTGAGWRILRLELEGLGTLTDSPEDLTEHEVRDMETNRRRRQGIQGSHGDGFPWKP